MLSSTFELRGCLGFDLSWGDRMMPSFAESIPLLSARSRLLAIFWPCSPVNEGQRKAIAVSLKIALEQAFRGPKFPRWDGRGPPQCPW